MNLVRDVKKRKWLPVAIAILCILTGLWLAHDKLTRPIPINKRSEPRPSNQTPSAGPSHELNPQAIGHGIDLTAPTPSPPARIIDKVIGGTFKSGKRLIEVDYIDEVTKRPVTSGTITIEPFYGPDLNVELDGEGRVFLEADPGDYYLRSSCPGYYKTMEKIVASMTPGNVLKIVRLSKSIHLRGMVRNADGNAQPDAYIVMVQGQDSNMARSGSNGLFEVELPAQNIDRIYAFRPPHPIAELGPLTFSETQNPFVEITLPKDSKTVKLTGRIWDDQKQPVEDAVIECRTTSVYRERDLPIRVLMAEDSSHETIRSDSAGRFMIEFLPERKVTLSVHAQDLESYSEVLDVLRDTQLEIRLKSVPRFKVRVQDIDGHQVSGLGILAYSPDSNGRSVLNYSSEKGYYTATSYPFTIFATGLNTNLGTTASAWIGGFNDEITLTLGQAQIAGRAVDEAGNPIRFIRVDLMLTRTDSYRCGGWLEFYSSDGSFLIKHLVQGEASLSISPGFSEQRKILDEFQQSVIVGDGRTTFVSAVLKSK